MKREAAVAGQFYPRSGKELRALIKTMVNENAVREDIAGYYAPHAGYIYSGPVVGAIVSRVQLKETFVILCPSHTGLGAPFSIMTEGSWQTPLGEIQIENRLAKQILASSSYLREDVLAHLQEHAIEVQLPFLQYFKTDFKIVPIVLSHASAAVYKDIGNAVAKAVKSAGNGVVIVASGDMTHYESQKTAQEKDQRAIDAMLKLDPEGLLKRVQEHNITMCGYAPAAVLIYAVKELGADAAELVKYMTSGDTTGDYASVVGYAGVLFKKRG
jgi:AmmeMemoRadiSam system protein B